MIFANRFASRHAVINGGAEGLGTGIAARIKAEGGTIEIWDINADALAAITDHATRQIIPRLVGPAIEDTRKC